MESLNVQEYPILDIRIISLFGNSDFYMGGGDNCDNAGACTDHSSCDCEGCCTDCYATCDSSSACDCYGCDSE